MPPHIVWTRSLYQGWTTLRLVRLRLESGDVVDSEVEDHGNAVAVLPFDPARRTALLVRILRAPAFLSTGRVELLECPAGLMEEADPAEIARREAYEEVGLRLRDLEHVGRIWTSPGISTEIMDMYLAPYSGADREHAGGGLASEHEHIEVTELGLDRLWSMVERKEIDDLKTLTLVLMLRNSPPGPFWRDGRAVSLCIVRLPERSVFEFMRDLFQRGGAIFIFRWSPASSSASCSARCSGCLTVDDTDSLGTKLGSAPFIEHATFR